MRRSRRGLQHRTQPLMQVFLHPGDVNVKLEDFRSESMLIGKFLRAMDAALPGRHGHRVIIIAVSNWSNLAGRPCPASDPYTSPEERSVQNDASLHKLQAN